MRVDCNLEERTCVLVQRFIIYFVLWQTMQFPQWINKVALYFVSCNACMVLKVKTYHGLTIVQKFRPRLSSSKAKDKNIIKITISAPSTRRDEFRGERHRSLRAALGLDQLAHEGQLRWTTSSWREGHDSAGHVPARQESPDHHPPGRHQHRQTGQGLCD